MKVGIVGAGAVGAAAAMATAPARAVLSEAQLDATDRAILVGHARREPQRFHERPV